MDSLLADYRKPEGLIGENGLLKQLTKLLLEKALEAEMADHLAHGKMSLWRGSFPSDEALLKLFYLALRNISRIWTMLIRDWELTRFTIQFEDQMNNLYPPPVTQNFGHSLTSLLHAMTATGT